mmetsp:Transcript_11428/g.26785  ORF Transcript_11428/g.26785 Transcript_11428/m.26785 type:complete len:95 (+) Transcript_11428:64-348(+)
MRRVGLTRHALCAISESGASWRTSARMEFLRMCDEIISLISALVWKLKHACDPPDTWEPYVPSPLGGFNQVGPGTLATLPVCVDGVWDDERAPE